MYLIDANILLYAKIDSFKHHAKALEWLDTTINSGIRVGIPWESINAFIRISTNHKIIENPLSTSAAWQQIKEWLDLTNLWIPVPTEDHIRILDQLIKYCEGTSGLIHDAHLASIALSHGLKVVSSDADFARFPNVIWENPCI